MEKDQRVTNLEIKLWRAAVITGRVLDPEGEPVPGAEVRAYGIYSRHGKPVTRERGRTRTDDRGKYRIFGLPARRYIVRAWPPREESPAGQLYAGAATYYPNGLTPSEALRLELGWGQELGRDQSALLRPAYLCGQRAGTRRGDWRTLSELPDLRCPVRRTPAGKPAGES